jgi:hypothetical protein
MGIELVINGRRMAIPRGWVILLLTLACWGVVFALGFALWWLVGLIA